MPRPTPGRRLSWPGLAGGLLIALLTGCATKTVTVARLPEAPLPEPGASIAVVPFENLSLSRNAGLILTDLAASILYTEPTLRVVEVSRLQDAAETRFRRLEVDAWERQLGMNTAAGAALGRALDVDWVLVGSVGEYGFVDGFGETANVGVTLRLVQVADEAVVWAGSLSRRAAGSAFSEESVHRLAHEVLRDLLGLMSREIQAYQTASSPPPEA